MKARIVNNEAIEVCENPEKLYHPNLADEFVIVPDGISQGWKYDKKKDKWSAPVGVVIPEQL